MLKIKDNVNLKELEKFGFREVVEEDAYHWFRGHKYIYERELYFNQSLYTVYINKNNYIKIEIHGGCIIVGSLQTLLFDLIEAGLVERVDKVREND